MARFCPVCGKNVDIESFKKYGKCSACYYAEHPVFKIPDKDRITIQICPICYKFRSTDDTDKAWFIPVEKDFENIWFQAIYQFLITRIVGYEAIEFSIGFTRTPDIPDHGKKNIVHFSLEGIPREELDNEDPPKTRYQDVVLQYSVGACEDCAKKNAGYHNAVIQIRTSIKRPSNGDQIARVVDEIKRLAQKSDFHGLEQIASIDEVAGGVDLKILSKKFGKSAAYHVKRTFCIDLKESFKVTGPDWETGGSLKRLFYGIRLHSFLVGDVLVIPSKPREPHVITKILPETIHLMSLATGRIDHAKPEDLTGESIVFKVDSDDPATFQVVSINGADNTVNLMNTSTYEEVITNPQPWQGTFKENGTINGIVHEGITFLFPQHASSKPEDEDDAGGNL
nr:NMD3-related protein [Candidatus Sigynarchaeota archaeon]